MKCHELDYKIYGDDLQFVEVELDNGETVIGEAGAMMYMEEGITFEAKMGDGSKTNEDFFSKMLNAGKRLLTGESLFLTHFTSKKEGKTHVSFSGAYPGKILPIDMKNINGYLISEKDAFLCAAYGTEIGIEFAKKISTGFFGGEGFILQKIVGDGLVFLNSGGYIHCKELNNETIFVDTGCVVAFESSVNYDIQKAGNLKTMLFGGEGIFLARLSGKGKIWIQSMPFTRLANKVIKSSTEIDGAAKGEGSIIGGLGSLFESH